MSLILVTSIAIRVLALLWDNGGANDCMTSSPPYVTDACFSAMDAVVRQVGGPPRTRDLARRGSGTATPRIP